VPHLWSECQFRVYNHPRYYRGCAVRAVVGVAKGLGETMRRMREHCLIVVGQNQRSPATPAISDRRLKASAETGLAASGMSIDVSALMWCPLRAAGVRHGVSPCASRYAEVPRLRSSIINTVPLLPLAPDTAGGHRGNLGPPIRSGINDGIRSPCQACASRGWKNRIRLVASRFRTLSATPLT
jgi:hypothetical protein